MLLLALSRTCFIQQWDISERPYTTLTFSMNISNQRLGLSEDANLSRWLKGNVFFPFLLPSHSKAQVLPEGAWYANKYGIAQTSLPSWAATESGH